MWRVPLPHIHGDDIGDQHIVSGLHRRSHQFPTTSKQPRRRGRAPRSTPPRAGCTPPTPADKNTYANALGIPRADQRLWRGEPTHPNARKLPSPTAYFPWCAVAGLYRVRRSRAARPPGVSRSTAIIVVVLVQAGVTMSVGVGMVSRCAGGTTGSGSRRRRRTGGASTWCSPPLSLECRSLLVQRRPAGRRMTISPRVTRRFEQLEANRDHANFLALRRVDLTNVARGWSSRVAVGLTLSTGSRSNISSNEV